MDWVEEKAEKFRIWVKNLSFRKAMAAYILILAVLVWLLSYATMTVCIRFETVIWNRYDSSQDYDPAISPIMAHGLSWSDAYTDFAENDRRSMILLNIVRVWCPFVYSFTGMLAAIEVFYRKRLREPFQILEEGARKISSADLDFKMEYDSRDEMGQLCEAFEEMRRELVSDKEEMWRLVEKQKELNSAFAHDLRTPLTVIKGYTDFLARYIPEGKLSEEKLLDTLRLMSGHVERLERYSRTMKGIRSIEEMPVERREIALTDLGKEIAQVIFALNQIGDIGITLEESKGEKDFVCICTDDNIVMEVLENLLSNAIRYAKTSIETSLEYDSTAGELVMTVRDDGPGFSEEDLKNAVLPYHKEHKEEGEHFGIGLHIASLLCRKHGGFLSIANSIAGGAIVTASFFCKNESRES